MTFARTLQQDRSYLRPKPFLHLDEWADEYRYLSPESAAEPGKWRTDKIGIARFPMRAITNPRIREITVVSCTQLLKTELILNAIGYYMHWEPSSIINMLPDLNLADAMSTERVKPMLRDSPELKKLVGNVLDDGSRRTGLNKNKDKTRTIGFKGGVLNFIGANSPAALSMRPVRIVLADETDKYKSDVGRKDNGEGDPLLVLQERAGTFKNRKLINACSPTTEGHSRIMRKYEQSNMCVPLAKCPHCDEYNDLQFFKSTKKTSRGEITGGVIWDKGQPETAMYYCTECGEPWKEHERQRAVSYDNLKLRVDNPNVTQHFGIIVSKMFSPWEGMPVLAQKFEDSKNSPEELKTFFNTQLAKTFKEKGDAPGWKTLYNRREKYDVNTIPSKRALVVVAAIDVQKGKDSRLEASIYAFGQHHESWLIDHRYYYGDTSDPKSGAWKDAEELLTEKFKHPGGLTMDIEAIAVDSGDQAHVVYQWAMHKHKVHVIKGDNIPMVIGRARSVDIKTSGYGVIKNGVKLWSVGSSFVKKEQFDWMKLELGEDGQIPTGYIHFPEEMPDYFFQGLTNEVMMIKNVRGYAHEIWEKIGPNEPLDTRCYCRAMVDRLGYSRMSAESWQERYDLYNKPSKAHNAVNHSAAPAAPQQQKPARRKSKYWD